MNTINNNEKEPLISIVIPVYQVESYINTCINSVITQTFDQWELILVDDGSTDNCGLLCDNYAKKDSRIHVIHKRNEGLLKARIDGTAVASADYVTFIDGDDYILSDRLKTLWTAIVTTSAEMVSTSFCKRFDNGMIKPAEKTGFQGLYTGVSLKTMLNDYMKEYSCKGSLYSFSYIFNKKP